MNDAGVHSNILSTVNSVSFTVKILGLQLFHYLPYDFSGGLYTKRLQMIGDRNGFHEKESEARYQFACEKLHLHPKSPQYIVKKIITF